MKTKPNTIIEYGLLFLIVFTPLAFGSVHVWAYTIVEAVVLLLLLTFLFSCLTPSSSLLAPRSSLLTFHPLRFTLPFIIFLGLILFQMVPLPSAVLKHLSPNTYALYHQTLGNGREQGAGSTEPNPLPHAPSPTPPPLSVKSEMLEVTPHDSRFTFHDSRSISVYRNGTKTEFLKFFTYLSVLFLIITTMTTTRQLRRMALAIIFTGTGVAFLALCQILSKSDKIYGFWQSQQYLGKIGYYGGQIEFYGGPFINPNHLAGYLAMVIPLALGFLLNREAPGIIRSAKNWKQRLSLLEPWLAKNALLSFIVVLMAAALLISGSRGGIVAFVFSLGLFFLLLGVRRSRKGKRPMVLLITGLIFIFLLWVGIGPVVTELATLADPTVSGLLTRLQVSKDTLSLARDFPVFGVGLGNFQNLYPKYQTFPYPFLWDHAHNDYVEMLADTGLMGLFMFFGGILLSLFAILKTSTQRRDPLLANIALGGFIGATALLCHCLIEFNLHIPANVFLLFVILGLGLAAVNLKKKEEESSPLSVRIGSTSAEIRTALIAVQALVIVFLLTLVIKDYLGHRFFITYQSLTPRASSLAPLERAIFFDPGNAAYHYELGNYYARKISESWKQGTPTISGEQWIADAEKNTRFCGVKALQAYAVAVNLSPADPWYHFSLGWTLKELKGFSDFSQDPITLSEFGDAQTEFSRAIMLHPNNRDIKNYLDSVKSKK